MSTVETIRTNLGAVFPGAAPANLDAFAALLADVAEGRVAPGDFPARFAQDAALQGFGQAVAGQQLRMGPQVVGFDAAGRPFPTGNTVDAHNSQGAVINPSGVVMQFYASANAGQAPASLPMRRRVFLSYDADDVAARAAAEAVQARLRQPDLDCDVFALPQSEAGGATWQQDLSTVIGLTHAGVLFLSGNACRTEAVYQIASLLTVRALIGEPFRFVFVPVLLPPLTAAQLDAPESLLAALQLGALPPVQAGDPATISAQVAAALAPLAARGPTWTLFETLADNIARDLRNQALAPGLLQTIAVALGRQFTQMPAAEMQVAWSLWHTDPVRVGGVIPLLRNALGANLAPLIGKIAPGWVKPWAARWIPTAATRPAGRRAVVINSPDTFVAQCFFRRAYCLLDVPKGLVPVLAGTDGADVATLQETIRAEISGQLMKRRPPPPPAELATWIQWYTERQGPIFVLLPLPAPAIARQLQQAFPEVTFFFQTQGALPEDDGAYKDVLFIRPPLTMDEQNAAYSYM